MDLNTTIYKHELRTLSKSTLIWSISFVVIASFFLSLFPGFSKDAEIYREMLDNYPPEVLKAIGAKLDMISTFNGFYSFCFIYIALCGAIQGIISGISILAKEGARKTTDFLLTKPVSRFNILASKYLAVLTSIAVTNIVFVVSVSIIAKLINRVVSVETSDNLSSPVDYKAFYLITFSLIFIQLIFSSLGFLFAAVIKKIKSPASVGLGIIISFFIISMISNVTDDQKLKYISFLTYFKSDYIIENRTYDMKFLICALSAFVIFIVTAFVYYTKKDIHYT